MRSNLTLIIYVALLLMTNSRTNLNLPTRPSWRVPSTMPSNGWMPLKMTQKRNTRRNKRSSRLLPSKPFLILGLDWILTRSFLAPSCKDSMALQVVYLVHFLNFYMISLFPHNDCSACFLAESLAYHQNMFGYCDNNIVVYFVVNG